MGAKAYELPTSEGVIPNTIAKTAYKESVFNEVTKKYEEIEKTSTISEFKGGSLLGWNLKAKAKCVIKFWGNSKEAKGINFGPISLNENESIRDWFGSNGLEFKEGIFMQVISGEVPEGVIFADIE